MDAFFCHPRDHVKQSLSRARARKKNLGGGVEEEIYTEPEIGGKVVDLNGRRALFPETRRN